MRRQNRHVQHVHAALFAGLLTALIAALILHTEYGFWHERYVAEEIVAKQEVLDAPSPSESLSRFLSEAKERFGAIGSTGFLEGKETYMKDSE